MNAQKECLKMKSQVSSQKVGKENKSKEGKNDRHFIKGKDFIRLCISRLNEPISMNFGLLIINTMKVLTL